ncbi:MAG: hypothetical protein K2X66_02200 [Cyanobacteria bacterium]|nr:hypothetical protein [Cyanobacteriota bacterium]
MKYSILIPVHHLPNPIKDEELVVLFKTLLSLSFLQTPEFEIVLIDDATLGETQQLIQGFSQQLSAEERRSFRLPTLLNHTLNVKTIRHKAPLGDAQCYLSGFHYLIHQQNLSELPTDKTENSYVITLEASNHRQLQLIPQWIESLERQNADILTPKAFDAENPWTWLKPTQCLNNLLNFILAKVFGMEIGADFTSSLRIYRLNTLETLIEQFGPCFLRQKGLAGTLEILSKSQWLCTTILSIAPEKGTHYQLFSDPLPPPLEKPFEILQGLWQHFQWMNQLKKLRPEPVPSYSLDALYPNTSYQSRLGQNL